jgi:MFS family permease
VDGLIDSRGPRLGQAAVAVVLVTGFVFSWTVLIPLVALVTLAAALAGPERDPVTRLLTGDWAARVWRRPSTPEDPRALRLTSVLETGVLLLASLLVAAGVSSLAWVLALAVALAAALMAVTGVCLGCELYEKLQKNRRIR